MGSSLAYILIHVDDIVVTTDYDMFLQAFIAHLGVAFSLKDLGAFFSFSWVFMLGKHIMVSCLLKSAIFGIS